MPIPPRLPDGLVAIVKRSCPTCEMIVPVLAQLAESSTPLAVWSQDDPAFPPGLDAGDDRELELSYRLGIATAPTLLRVEDGSEVGRLEGGRGATGRR